MFVYKGKAKIFDHSYSKELSNVIHQSYETGTKPANHKNLSYALEKFLTQSGLGDILDSINGISSFIEGLFYIISTYTFPETSSKNKSINNVIQIIETIFLIYFILHYFLRIYCSQNRILFIFDLINLVDIASSVCLIISQRDFAKNTNVGYFLRMSRMFRLFYIMKLEYIVQRKTNEQIRHLFNASSTLVSIVFVSAAIILEFENYNFRENSEPRELRKIPSYTNYLSFHDVIYFMFVTLTTIGFGDITPQSLLGRISIIICVGIIISVIPALFSKISIQLSLNSKYSLARYVKSSKIPKHLVLVGDCGPESFDACLQELYNEDHGNVDFDTVILQVKPNESMLKIFHRKSYENQVYYLVGNVLDQKDLNRARTDNSICVIILANKLTANHRQEDFNNIMKAFSIKKYSNMICGEPKTRVYIQLILPETKEMYYNSLIQKNEYEQGPQIICLEEIKLQMLGKSCQCQGINTIIAALTTSQKPSIGDINGIQSFSKWMEEYLEGLENEIYCIKIKCEYLHNLTFNDLVKIIYELTGFIVIGTDVIYQDLKPFVCLNPYNYIFSPFDHLIYLLASSQPNESEINQLIEKYLEKNKKGVVENNIELVKVRRLKTGFWAHLNRDYQPIKRKDIDEEEEDEDDKIDDSNINLGNILSKEEENKINEIFKNSLKDKNQDPSIINKRGFISTLRPRTQHESEFFSGELLEHHVIICGVNPNIKHLIMPLRARNKAKHFPILIIDKNEHISSEIWKEIQYFPDIYYMQGNPIKSDDLKKAGVSKAQAVVILSKYNQDNELLEMMDADSIFIYKAVKNESKKTLIIADLISTNSIGYLSAASDENSDSHGFWLSEPFASGELYISSMLDTLICQAFYNPYILNIISQLMLGESTFKFPEETLITLNKHKFLNSSLNLYKIKELLEKYKYQNLNASRKIHFKLIFEFLVDKNMIPLGILRAPTDEIKQKFVFLAPSKETIIDCENDELYVISSEEEGRELDERNKNFSEMYSVDLIEKSNVTLNDLCDKMKKGVEEININLKNELSVKNLISLTRNCLKKQFIWVHQQKEEQIIKAVKEELIKNNQEIREDSDEIEIEDSDNLSSKD